MKRKAKQVEAQLPKRPRGRPAKDGRKITIKLSTELADKAERIGKQDGAHITRGIEIALERARE